jgi:DNA-binding beta-propeller fold protein YncE
MKPIFVFNYYFCFIWLLVITIASCASTGGPEMALRWPPPPANPRVEFKRNITGTASLKRSFFGQVKDFFFGKSKDQYLTKPYGISSDDSKLYLADTGIKGVIILDLIAGTGKYIFSAGPNEKLQEPVNVVQDKNGNVYVADTKLGKIAVYSQDLNFSHFIGAMNELTCPVGMAIDEKRNRIYVVDSQQHQVHKFSLAGDHEGYFGRRGDERGEFYHPLGITLSPGDTLYVTDAFHFAVQAFDIEGNYLFSFGPRRHGVGTMARPRDIDLDPDGNIYVTDALKHEVQVYDRAGTYLFSIGNMGVGDGQFRLPAGIHITSSGQIFVVDSINRRIQEFLYLGRV